jgi:hypothetical protein
VVQASFSLRRELAVTTKQLWQRRKDAEKGKAVRMDRMLRTALG